MSLLATVPPGVYVTEQDAEAVVPLNVHVPVNVPLPVVVRTTTPVGVMNVPGEWSVTVTVQLVAVPMVAGELQVNEEVSDLTVTVKLAVAFGLAAK